MHDDPLWMRAFLVVHITAGFSSFVLAPVALATAKGGKQHKRWGMVYLWSMGAVAGTALPMALFRPVLFLALVAVFSFYAAFSGYRVLRLKGLVQGGSARPDRLDCGWGDVCFKCGAGVDGVAAAGVGAGYGDRFDRVWGFWECGWRLCS